MWARRAPAKKKRTHMINNIIKKQKEDKKSADRFSGRLSDGGRLHRLSGRLLSLLILQKRTHMSNNVSKKKAREKADLFSGGSKSLVCDRGEVAVAGCLERQFFFAGGAPPLARTWCAGRSKLRFSRRGRRMHHRCLFYRKKAMSAKHHHIHQRETETHIVHMRA